MGHCPHWVGRSSCQLVLGLIPDPGPSGSSVIREEQSGLRAVANSSTPQFCSYCSYKLILGIWRWGRKTETSHEVPTGCTRGAGASTGQGPWASTCSLLTVTPKVHLQHAVQ